MPVIFNTDYNPPFILKNKHINTIIPALFRKVEGIKYKRHRIETNDNDFIDFDLSSVSSVTTAIISHGLEGNSHKPYVKGMAKALNGIGIDAVAANYRGCSGEPNRLISSYHSGKTDDLALLVDYLTNVFKYESIILIGFSLGGNITLKYLGELANKVPSNIKAAITISVPCDLKASAIQLNKTSNFIYLHRFLKSLKQKALLKIDNGNYNDISRTAILRCKNFCDFDNLFTAPVHGFKNADDYWSKCSSKQFLKAIRVSTLIINALDDPFLSKSCYPFTEAENNQEIILEMPKYGGHVGFINKNGLKNELWHENRTILFIKEKMKLSFGD